MEGMPEMEDQGGSGKGEGLCCENELSFRLDMTVTPNNSQCPSSTNYLCNQHKSSVHAWALNMPSFIGGGEGWGMGWEGGAQKVAILP